jgi:hypothetical protein
MRVETVKSVSLIDEPALNVGAAFISSEVAEKAIFLKIGISSEVDFVDLARRAVVNIHYSAYRCIDSSHVQKEVLALADLEVGKEPLEWAIGFSKPSLKGYRRTDGRILYYAFVPLESPEMRRVRPPMRFSNEIRGLFDPGVDDNLCLVVRAGKMWIGEMFASEPLVVTKAEISRSR